MNYEIKIGDKIRITDIGHQYCGHVVKVMELGGDVSPYIRAYYKNNGNTIGMKHDIAMADKSTKWTYEYVCNTGDICEVVGIDTSTDHVLIERNGDSKQFLMDAPGCQVLETSMFVDEDFLV
jgi:hypothetical protein